MADPASRCSPLSAEQERTEASRLYPEAGTKMAPGDEWYVISARWFALWKSYTHFTADEPEEDDDDEGGNAVVAMRPGPIDNSDIVASPPPARSPVCVGPTATATTTTTDELDFGTELREKLHGGYDYALVPAKLWYAMRQWYGGGPAVLRRAISEGTGSRAQVRVEVYPLRVKAQVTDVRGSVNPSTEEDVVVSKAATAAQLKARLCKQWEIADASKTRLWAVGGKTHKRIKEESETLEALCMSDGARFLLEVQLTSGEWPKDNAAVASVSAKDIGKKKGKSLLRRFADFIIGPAWDDDYEDPAVPDNEPPAPSGTHPPGICGLHNLGNTCFMNSALQCLSNTEPLCVYFASGDFKKDVNPKNTMGMKGQLAEQFGKLMAATWSGSYTAIAPRSFKQTLGKWAPQFSGFSQHDSQEFLAFLLDGLHEDLNEVSKKPFVEVPEGGTRPDAEVADEAWAGHRRRNRSLIVDTFQGQLKSTLVCPDCNKTSITFDPFMYLSLPLPTERDRVFEVVVFKYIPEPATQFPLKYSVKVPKRAKIEQIKAEMSPLCGIPVSEMHFANSYCNKLYSYLPSDCSVNSIHDSDINLIYQIPPHDPKDGSFRVHVVHRRANPEAPATTFTRCPWKLMGLPFVLQLEAGTTGATAYAEVWGRIKKYLGQLASQPPFLPGTAAQAASASTSSTAEDKSETSEMSTSSGDVSMPDVDAEHPHPKPHRHRHHHHHHHHHEAASAEKSETAAAPALEVHKLQHAQHTYDSAAGQEYPFRLSLVSSTGLSCSKCPFNDSCFGCAVACDASQPDWAALMKYSTTVTLSVDWCAECMALNQNVEPNTSSVQVHESTRALRAEATRAVSLDDCMRLFASNEQLGPDDPWYCPGCKQHKQAFKKFDLWRIPKVLVVHLKRFQYSRHFREKLMTDVDFPIDSWDISRFVPPQKVPPRYRLFAVSNHMGGLAGGHYTAYGRNKDTGKWYLFNDSSCHEVSPSGVRGNSAYVLFYELIDEHEATPSVERSSQGGEESTKSTASTRATASAVPSGSQ